MTCLRIIRADGILTVQDMGRPGHLAQGLSRGGAMDRQALIEAAALLGSVRPLAAIEMAGAGGAFGVSEPTRVALTGAPMVATLDDAPLRWHASHRLQPGQTLRIGGAQAGVHGYLTPAGGIATPEWLGSRAAHLTIGIGEALEGGSALPCHPDPDPDRPDRVIDAAARFNGGTVRVMDGPQTGLFDEAMLDAFFGTDFTRGPRGNRQGVQLQADARFTSDQAAGLASDVIGPGDVQMTGDGVPYVLMAECQTIGGYPRIGQVIPADLPVIAQAVPGAVLRFQRLTAVQADALYRSDAVALREAAGRCRNLVRDPATIPDLLSYQLVGGVTAGRELEE
ncbi:biotin-dependent carboxyltransferase family protein [Paracoccus salsus]|uniref:5-oxoprolinase subunit C family protein n=1 Tax=Paracoccus salsus TaxID=2911061 RepID=UPI001F3A05DD|nr:biotin-dependent carboxyltransferase family protein [Paracoccus salsus]MCF3973368.1 biotin-dependent carboxyltransferase family protein [Paracoccus salsus]